MTLETDLTNSVNQLVVDVAHIHSFVTGADNETVVVDGGSEIKTIRKLTKDLEDTYNATGSGLVDLCEAARDLANGYSSSAGTAQAAAEAAQAAAEAAAASAVEVVTGGTASLTPEAGKIPLADGEGHINGDWLGTLDELSLLYPFDDPVGVAIDIPRTPVLGADKSWAQESRPTGRYLGIFIDQAAARAAGGVDGDWYTNTTLTDPHFYVLEPGSTQSVIYRAGSTDYPAAVAWVAWTTHTVAFDLTKPGFPMWISFRNNQNNSVIRHSPTCIAVQDGEIVVGTNSGVYHVSLSGDFSHRHTSSVTYQGMLLNNLASRYGAGGDAIWQYNVDLGFVMKAYTAVRSVAITTLPDAPINHDTGRPAITIAVALDTGLSIYVNQEITYNNNLTVDMNGVGFINEHLVGYEGVFANEFRWYGRVDELTAGFTHINSLHYQRAVGALYTRKPATAGSPAIRGHSPKAFATGSTGYPYFVQMRLDTIKASQGDRCDRAWNGYANVSGWLMGTPWIACCSGDATTNLIDDWANMTSNGTHSLSPVAAGAELQAVTNWATGNSLSLANADCPDIFTDTPAYCMIAWVYRVATPSGILRIFHLGDDITVGNFIHLYLDANMDLSVWEKDTTGNTETFTDALPEAKWGMVSLRHFENGEHSVSVNGRELWRGDAGITPVFGASTTLNLGPGPGAPAGGMTGDMMALWRLTKGEVSDEQLRFIYEQEKHLFEPNAKCLIQGSSADVKSMAHDESLGLCHVFTGDHVTTFSGMRVVDSYASGFTLQAIKCADADRGFLAAGGDSGVLLKSPSKHIRTAFLEGGMGKDTKRRTTFWYDGDSVNPQFTVPAGWKPLTVFVDGAQKRPGSLKDYTVEHDGFQWVIQFAAAPGAVDIAINAEEE